MKDWLVQYHRYQILILISVQENRRSDCPDDSHRDVVSLDPNTQRLRLQPANPVLEWRFILGCSNPLNFPLRLGIG